MFSIGAPISPKGIHHVGLVVSNVQASMAFYEECFGARVVLRVRNEEATLVMIDFGNAWLELLSFHNPGRTDVVLGASDLGAGHFALLLDDVADAYGRLSADGIQFLHAPVHVEDGPSAGYVIAFCLDPDGNRVELIQRP